MAKSLIARDLLAVYFASCILTPGVWQTCYSWASSVLPMGNWVADSQTKETSLIQWLSNIMFR